MALPELTATPQRSWYFILKQGLFLIAPITVIRSCNALVIKTTVCCQKG
jgi:hypothetical protein